jgi:sialate O-acetylesterase
MHVLFDNADGLTSKSSPESFEIAGADGAPGIAKIEGRTITVPSPTILEPQYVRYAWSNYPPVNHPANLYNAAGLSASTFTSYPMP